METDLGLVSQDPSTVYDAYTLWPLGELTCFQETLLNLDTFKGSLWMLLAEWL